MFLVNSIWSQQQQEQQEDCEIMKDYLNDDMEIAMKVVIVGNGSVGKSSMIQRFCRGIFTRDYKKTIGVDFLERILTIDDHSIRLMLWDTAGQEEFDAITRTYYRGANACVLACSVTDKESFNSLLKWKTKVCRECGDIPMVLVANKVDLQKQTVVDSSELEAMAKSLGITKLFKTSVKDDLNVTTVFNHLAREYVLTVMSMIDTDDDETLDDEETNDFDPNSNIPSSYPLFGNPNSNNNKYFKNKNNKSKSYYNNSSNTNNGIGNNRHNLNLKQQQQQQQHQSFLPLKQQKTKSSFKNPVILKSSSQPQQPLQLPIKKFFSSTKKNIINHHEQFGYTYSPSGNHHTHWDNNMPFRLDLIDRVGNKKKRKDGICNIL